MKQANADSPRQPGGRRQRHHGSRREFLEGAVSVGAMVALALPGSVSGPRGARHRGPAPAGSGPGHRRLLRLVHRHGGEFGGSRREG